MTVHIHPSIHHTKVVSLDPPTTQRFLFIHNFFHVLEAEQLIARTAWYTPADTCQHVHTAATLVRKCGARQESAVVSPLLRGDVRASLGASSQSALAFAIRRPEKRGNLFGDSEIRRNSPIRADRSGSDFCGRCRRISRRGPIGARVTNSKNGGQMALCHFPAAPVPRPESSVNYAVFGGKRIPSNVDAGFTSVCNADFRILVIDPRFLESSHDSWVWQRNPLCEQLASQLELGDYVLGYPRLDSGRLRKYGSFVEEIPLTGKAAAQFMWPVECDSGYLLDTWLLTPVPGNLAPGTPECEYKEHTSMRNVVGKCIGVLKSRFRCLQRYRALLYKPDRAAGIVSACAALHNIALEAGEPVFAEDSDGGDMPPAPV
ncbi:hypothetical protein HPB50_007251 [Hyalomma asiaticum]|uniref:Uncharacterized protein n=1 Tax=Hyalomma asiaticum TaxID=266040 RepID=A0ACB7TD78_HYAAI|nr:hypothetical protein HPB50_007251 [Hyalomma asiaticum]